VNNANRHQDMLIKVASALGVELCQQMTFVGGCTTGLLLTDEFTREQVRHTDDVDLIVHVLSYASYTKLQERLRGRGFREIIDDSDDPICAMQLGELRVDFMPDNEVLGFSNCWYKDALINADDYDLTSEITIRLVKPVYFVATKLEAYLGRGNNDPLASRDIEDLLNLFDGREELIKEIEQSSFELQKFIAEQLSALLDNSDFDYAVQSCSLGDSDREALIFERLEQIARGRK
jgi:predicted nucleotidyltransferase